MVNEFRETTTRSWGSRILGSIKGVFIGFLLFLASFAFLFWNEGRINIANIAKTATEIESISKAPATIDKTLVSTTGEFLSTEKIGDDFLRTGDYISIRRTPRTYAWVEDDSSSTKTNVGGSQTTETTYTYSKQWVQNPANSSKFKNPTGHKNPTSKSSSKTTSVKTAELGIYHIDVNQIVLSDYRNLELNNANIILKDNFTLANSQYLFNGVGTIDSPEIGDVKISYQVMSYPIKTATVFGEIDISTSKISPYYGEKNTKLYRIFEGTRSTAISKMQTKFTILSWIFRLIGFLMMWVGLAALFDPISTLLDVLPIFGSISRGGILFITFLVSLLLSIITIIISIIMHNLIFLIITIVLIVVCVILYMKNKRKRQVSTTNTQTNSTY